MQERGKNILVGLTVLVGLAMFAGMIVMFAGLPEWFSTGQRIEITLPQTYDIVSGDPIYLSGMRVGMVRKVQFTHGDPCHGVTMVVTMNANVRLPKNIQARVRKKGLTGKGVLFLTPAESAEGAGEQVAFYPRDVTVHLVGKKAAGGGLLPKELTSAFNDFGTLARSLNALVEGQDDATATDPPTGNGLRGMTVRLSRTLDSIYEITGDKANQDNIKESLAGLQSMTGAENQKALHQLLTNLEQFAGKENQKQLRDALASLANASDGADELMRQLQSTAGAVSKLTGQLAAVTKKIDSGKGTAGKLINDPALYVNLVEAVEQIEALARDLRAMTATWKKEGVGVKLK
jgi:phospholipid/cholesterol/gamma-HCH transport system substrate-binding protein